MKRRNLMKGCFHELQILVPKLRRDGITKKNMLIETAKFLEKLLDGNEALKRVVGEQ